ncbi:MAG: replication restart helicase PriA [Planctomycetota bacterium]
MNDRDSGHLFGPAPKAGKSAVRSRRGKRGRAAPEGLLAPMSATEVARLDALAPGETPRAPPAYVDLAVDVFAEPETTFTYRWPAELGALPPPGTPLLVQFGPGRGTLRVGWLIAAREPDSPPPAFGPSGRRLRYRPVLERLGLPGLLPPDLLELGRFLTHYYRAPWGECLSAMAPPGVLRNTERQAVRRLAPAQVAYDDLPAAIAALGDRKRAQRAVLEALQLAGEPLTRQELLALCRTRGAGGGPGAIQALLKAGVLAELAESVPDPYHLPGLGGRSEPWALTPDQAHAVERIGAALEAREFRPLLLHGVTGSGKTEVYLHALAACLKQGRSALVLVPEITLTPQTLARIQARAGAHVVTLHSHLTEGVRADHWLQAREGRAQVVVGTRSAIFAPLANLGLIVVDEEHETTYKQESSPRYNGRDLALWRGRQVGATVVLGSATPSLTSFHLANTGRCELLRLPTRVGAAQLPQVELIDTNTIERDLSGGDFDPQVGPPTLTPPLRAALKKTLAAGHQAILFVNRRGQHPVRHCRNCGWIDRCEHCDQVMTFHRVGPKAEAETTQAEPSGSSRPHETLPAAPRTEPLPAGFRMCHLCGRRAEGVVLRCPVCHSPDLHFLGAGTQRVEEELQREFPAARVARLDSDVTQSRSALLAVLTGLMTGEINILVGTQIVAKGLDFPNVTLVGIVDADGSLRQCDYLGAERTFQLIAQVTGRAGRGEWPGAVYIQTALPNATPIQHALHHDFEAFAKEEIAHRRALGYPPHRRIVRVVLQGRDYVRLKQAAADFARAWRAALAASQTTSNAGRRRPADGPAGVALKGPSPCEILKIKDRFRFHVVGFAPDHPRLAKLLAALPPVDKYIQRIVDVDPLNML